MQEHLFIGKFGHFFVLLAFTASLLSTISYFIASRKKDVQEQNAWIKFARTYFFIETIAVITIFISIFIICYNHYFEYLYAWKHTSKELETRYLLACIWEDQSGSFLLWTIWHCILGIVIMIRRKEWEAPVMTVIGLAQTFLALMIMGVYFFGVKIGNSPFALTKEEIQAPIFSSPEYLLAITKMHEENGMGLNVLLRNYWMVIHPPVLFLGFASTIIPFAFAYAGMQTKRFADWIKPALPFALFSACVLGVGIMMGGKWAYESLSFGGYWAWDPVENASLVPWLILIAGLHTMVVHKATGHSLRASYLFVILTFIFILYSTTLTRTGVLGDTSVHAFTEKGIAMNVLISSFFIAFAVGSLILFGINYKKIPAIHKEESTSSREFWMFIGSLVLFLSSLFISAKTSLPVFNWMFGTHWAPPEDVEFSYNKVIILVAVIIGILSAITQYFKYKSTPSSFIRKKILIPTIAALVITILLYFIYPIDYHKQGYGFLGAIYFALFATIYSVIANASYIWSALNGKLKNAGASIAHAGFALMLTGILISSGNKKVISEDKFKNFFIPMGIDPLTKKQDNAAENINLIRQVPTTMGQYTVTYRGDSAGNEKGKRFYDLLFERKDSVTGNLAESFTLKPTVYLMKDKNMSSNPDIKSYLTHDIFTYISYTLNPETNQDTAHYTLHDVKEGDTIFYSKGIMIFNGVTKNAVDNKFKLSPANGIVVQANLTVIGKDSMKYIAEPVIQIDNESATSFEDTLYAQNLYVKFAGVTSDNKVKIAVKESEKIIDFVTIKAFYFPYIKLVWLGLLLMVAGFIVSIRQRANLSTPVVTIVLIVVLATLFYMFM
ncbi:cytochrome c biogenesis protein CcsA [Ferruginibacter albus]|uniref:cytochrome c biogenesis protein CcsA n=1 Tax=Ferruginibacter albus TaxID=2875540 RepID=UPI001CC7ED4D|nr:cytochrome c biogenesis protein CcsA [Ferruginibacter albus]